MVGIAALKKLADQWMVVKIGDQHWFSDGAAILACEGPEGSTGVTDTPKWRQGIERQVGGGTKHKGFQLAAKGPLVGAFMAGGYFRQFSPHVGRGFAYLNERYVRAVEADQSWFKGPKDPVVLTLREKLVAVIMPVEAKSLTTPMAERPEIPFLEDEVLYHDCEVEE